MFVCGYSRCVHIKTVDFFTLNCYVSKVTILTILVGGQCETEKAQFFHDVAVALPHREEREREKKIYFALQVLSVAQK